MSERFGPHTALLLLKMRLLISLEFNVKLDLHGDDALDRFFHYATRSRQDKLRQLSDELQRQTLGEPELAGALC